ncbi:uncharacterized protein LAESUDRAFT_667429 [Laetiporus sulphureus 93-53]|uniref:Protein kinase domain-containing protein n=1 Tax=Laetiporus sulphureus 93-53 TaxID=1314785 RepID=A0A165AYC1_9APHY|nr:uncharacterized protein LAESUDRAFT_667429 [Laetiporus sulphureus 93-53]KZS99889.1 hypothetical protein LAESUDRAFT_667429 [Laetiporus sulphureus 93-53]
MHKKGGKGPAANAKSPFGHLSKLEEFIPEEYFPDILLVHDADGLTPGVIRDTKRGSSKPFDAPSVRYKRVWPTESSELFKEAKYDDNIIHPLPEAEKPRTAHLYLSAQCVIGKGNHSLVYRAALRLPPPLKAIGPFGQVTTAAKLAIPEQSARDMLKTEADIYNKFPRHLMEHWSGYNLIAPHNFPVPVHAVVPKFYGYYVPEEDTPASDVSGLSPILLIEECGEPIDPKELSLDEQSQCYTHILRLHLEEFIQNSVFTRNILIQPGPLDVAPHFRSREHPSFRIIDFGRCEQVDDWFKHRYGKDPSEIKCTDENEEEVRGMYRPWVLKKSFQEAVAREQLGVDLMDA